MEKPGALIHLLQEQYEQGANPGTLIVTTQMILAELNLMQKPQNHLVKKVAVRMPANPYPVYNNNIVPPDQKQEIPSYGETGLPGTETKNIPGSNEQLPAEIAVSWGLHSVQEIPTFAHQEKELFELNESMRTEDFSLNERLKPSHQELAHALKDAPIKDLRKAIGINDRFHFINELFRGDENMYERSLKTIDAFHSLPEAEYWIQRELKVKIGWPEKNETVDMFDQLVRRRFSLK